MVRLICELLQEAVLSCRPVMFVVVWLQLLHVPVFYLSRLTLYLLPNIFLVV